MSLTLDQARSMIGRVVVYRPKPGYMGRVAPAEQGVITSVNARYVFVRYGANPGSQATDPADLEPLSSGGGA